MNDSLFYSECFVDEAEEGPLKVNTLNGSVAIWAFLTASRLFSRFFASKAVASGSTAFLRGSRVHCFVLSFPRAPPTVVKLRARPRAVGRKVSSSSSQRRSESGLLLLFSRASNNALN